ncbi:MAG: CoA-binding protein [Betaproteobacteria bacterium]|nr:CoA-binding protein [Betaproteobacteria bacterium]
MEHDAIDHGNPSENDIRDLLMRSKNIAVVGFSPKPHRASHNVARQMQRMGYRIIPVRPGISEGLGEIAYPDLASVPERIDIVDVFRASENTTPIFDECLRLGLKTIWLQDGVVNLEAAAQARAAGMLVIMDRCVLRDYTRLCV